MTVLTHADVERLAQAGLAHHAEYLDAAIRAVESRGSYRSRARARRDAAVLAVVAADDVPALAGELLHKTAEADCAHQHMVAATHEMWREKRRADAAEDEVTRLKALVDQLQAATDAATV
jgi:hypothetical protein